MMERQLPHEEGYGADAREIQQKYGALVAKAWGDEAFKQRLLREPAAVLAENGVALPPGVEVRVVESTADVVYLTLPPKPADELTEEQLSGVAGGGPILCCCVICCSSL